MKALHAFLSCFCFAAIATGQTPAFHWARAAGGSFNDFIRGIAVDSSGNVYVTGSFTGVAAFGVTNITSNGGLDLFVAKYDSLGNVLWVGQGGSTLYDDYGLAIAVDSQGNSYVTGAFSGDASFGTNTLHNVGGSEILVLKYDTNGNLLWARQAGGTSLNSGRGIAVDAAGNSYVTGYFQSVGTFGTTNQVTLTTSVVGDYDIFLAKYDGTGELVWVRQAGGSLNDVGFGIAVDSGGNSLLTGYFNSSTAMFDDTNLHNSNLVSTNSPDIFVAKYNSSGNVVWARQAGGAGIDEGFAIAVDFQGNSYLSGVFSETATFGGLTLTNGGGSANFIAKYNSAGSVAWAQKLAGGTDDGSGVVAVDAAGNSYFTGWFSGTASFANTNLTSTGSNDVFVAKFDGLGHQLWVKKAGGLKLDRGYAIAVDSVGNSYTSGFFEDTSNFDSFALNSAGGWDCFTARTDGPRLTIGRVANNIIISWPTNAAGLVLQTTTNITSGAVWLNSSTSPAIVGEQKVVTNTASGIATFYRLKN